MSFKKLKTYVFESPIFLAAIDVLLTALVGVFSGTLVTEITIDGKIAWHTWNTCFSFYALLFTLVLIILYKRMIIETSNSIMQFMDKDYCVAYARSQMLPEAAKRAREKIRDGNGGELLDAMEEINKVLQ